jgi:FAD dependent oxidoreductase TIGR03364
MKKIKRADIGIVGAGIMGLALAYQASKKGLKAVIFERNPKALGASVRNFGLIWPIGQPAGTYLQRAYNSRKTWKKLAEKAGFWYRENGSLHLAYHDDEVNLLQEFMEDAGNRGYQCTWLSAKEICEKNKSVNQHGLKGGMFSYTESCLNPAQAISSIPDWLNANFQVKLRFNTVVNAIDMPWIETHAERWKVDQAYVCSGTDFNSLYPEVFTESALIKCKLQMLQTEAQPTNWFLGPTLCGGLTLRHYMSFAHCHALHSLKSRIQAESPLYDRFGIHVLVTQNQDGELLIGDSHEYSLLEDPYNNENINLLILDYLQKMVNVPDLRIRKRWQGYYASQDQKRDFLVVPEKGVLVVNGLGGGGMTTAFGLAEEIMENL